MATCGECGEDGCGLHDDVRTRVCTKCDQPKPLTDYAKRGKGRHPWCGGCLAAYYKARRKKKPKKKAKPWLNPHSWEGHQHGELFLAYEDAVARAALLTVKAMGQRGAERKRSWAAAYSAAKRRDELRLLVMELLLS